MDYSIIHYIEPIWYSLFIDLYNQVKCLYLPMVTCVKFNVVYKYTVYPQKKLYFNMYTMNFVVFVIILVSRLIMLREFVGRFVNPIDIKKTLGWGV